MKPKIIRATSYVTDEQFARVHVRALEEFDVEDDDGPGRARPVGEALRPALIVAFDDERSRDAAEARVKALFAEPADAAQAMEEYQSYLLLLRRDLKAVLSHAIRSGALRAETRATLEDLCAALAREA